MLDTARYDRCSVIGSSFSHIGTARVDHGNLSSSCGNNEHCAGAPINKQKSSHIFTVINKDTVYLEDLNVGLRGLVCLPYLFCSL